MSVKDEMMKAKQLIQAKKYEDARALLTTIDHPTAEKWLSKLPASEGKPKVEAKRNPLANLGFAILQFAIALFVAGFFAWIAADSTGDYGADYGTTSLVIFVGLFVLVLFLANRLTARMRS